MSSFTVIKCDQCRQEGKRDESTGWRELRYISRIAPEVTDIDSKHFCSWACVAKYAGNAEGGSA